MSGDKKYQTKTVQTVKPNPQPGTAQQKQGSQPVTTVRPSTNPGSSLPMTEPKQKKETK